MSFLLSVCSSNEKDLEKMIIYAEGRQNFVFKNSQE